eukprot:gene22428-29540_t
MSLDLPSREDTASAFEFISLLKERDSMQIDMSSIDPFDVKCPSGLESSLTDVTVSSSSHSPWSMDQESPADEESDEDDIFFDSAKHFTVDEDHYADLDRVPPVPSTSSTEKDMKTVMKSTLSALSAHRMDGLFGAISRSVNYVNLGQGGITRSSVQVRIAVPWSDPEELAPDAISQPELSSVQVRIAVPWSDPEELAPDAISQPELVHIAVPWLDPEELAPDAIASLKSKLAARFPSTAVMGHTVRKGSLLIAFDILTAGALWIGEPREDTKPPSPQDWLEWIGLPWPKDGKNLYVQVSDKAHAFSWDEPSMSWLENEELTVPDMADVVTDVYPMVLIASEEDVYLQSSKMLSVVPGGGGHVLKARFGGSVLPVHVIKADLSDSPFEEVPAEGLLSVTLDMGAAKGPAVAMLEVWVDRIVVQSIPLLILPEKLANMADEINSLGFMSEADIGKPNGAPTVSSVAISKLGLWLDGKAYMVYLVVQWGVEMYKPWSWYCMDAHGVTPLHMAALTKRTKLVESLLRHFEPAAKAWTTAKGGLRYSPAEVASHIGLTILTKKPSRSLSERLSASSYSRFATPWESMGTGSRSEKLAPYSLQNTASNYSITENLFTVFSQPDISEVKAGCGKSSQPWSTPELTNVNCVFDVKDGVTDANSVSDVSCSTGSSCPAPSPQPSSEFQTESAKSHAPGGLSQSAALEPGSSQADPMSIVVEVKSTVMLLAGQLKTSAMAFTDSLKTFRCFGSPELDAKFKVYCNSTSAQTTQWFIPVFISIVLMAAIAAIRQGALIDVLLHISTAFVYLLGPYRASMNDVPRMSLWWTVTYLFRISAHLSFAFGWLDTVAFKVLLRRGPCRLIVTELILSPYQQGNLMPALVARLISVSANMIMFHVVNAQGTSQHLLYPVMSVALVMGVDYWRQKSYMQAMAAKKV